MQFGLCGPKTLPSGSVQNPLGPHVPWPYMPAPEVLKTSVVLLPVVPALPLPLGSNDVGSTGWMVGGVLSGEFQVPLCTGSPAPVVSGGSVDVVSPVLVVSPPPLVPPGKPGPGGRGPPATGVSRVPEPLGPVGLS